MPSRDSENSTEKAQRVGEGAPYHDKVFPLCSTARVEAGIPTVLCGGIGTVALCGRASSSGTNCAGMVPGQTRIMMRKNEHVKKTCAYCAQKGD
jgi:hypothetical protein